MNYQNYCMTRHLPAVLPKKLLPALFGGILGLFALTNTAQSQGTATSRATTSATAPPGLSAIRQQDIKTDIFAMAGDHFRGREAGTLDELKVAVWLAEKAKAAGLKPGGDDGTFFQYFSMRRSRISGASTVSVGDHSLALWKEVLIPQTATATVNAPLLYIDRNDTNRADIKGSAVAIMASPEGLDIKVSIPLRRYMSLVTRRYANGLIAKGAAAVIFIADDLAEAGWIVNASYADHGTYAVDETGGPAPARGGQGAQAGRGEGRNAGGLRGGERPPVIWLHASALDLVKTPNQQLHMNVMVEHFDYPSVNVIGIAEGKDPLLSKEYVLFSGHLDHDGVRAVPGTDSIYNGADDNASVNVALLAIARAFHQNPGRRSGLFVWHGAEERGLLGSRWYAIHPTVPKSSIVAVLNGDMIGRNSPDSAALLGVQPPHRNSPELVALALAANDEGPRFKLDTTYDKATHIEGWYFRSDHLPYARAGIPALFYTSLLHPDYHTPQDEPSRIDTEKITHIAQWMYRTGWKLANNNGRPALDPNFQLER